MSEYILLVIFKWYFCFRQVRINSTPNLGTFNFTSNIQKRLSTKNHQEKKNLSYIEWYKLNHLSSPFFLQILICLMGGCLKEKGHTKYIALNTQHFDYIFQDKQCETAQPSFPGSVFRSLNYLHRSTQSAQREEEAQLIFSLSSKFTGSCFPELTLWNLNFRDTEYSENSAKYTLFLTPQGRLSCEYSCLKRQVNSAWEVTSGNEGISGHLPRTKITNLFWVRQGPSCKACSRGLRHYPQAGSSKQSHFLEEGAKCRKATETENGPDSSSFLWLVFPPSSTFQIFLLSSTGKPCE